MYGASVAKLSLALAVLLIVSAIINKNVKNTQYICNLLHLLKKLLTLLLKIVLKCVDSVIYTNKIHAATNKKANMIKFYIIACIYIIMPLQYNYVNILALDNASQPHIYVQDAQYVETFNRWHLFTRTDLNGKQRYYAATYALEELDVNSPAETQSYFLLSHIDQNNFTVTFKPHFQLAEDMQAILYVHNIPHRMKALAKQAVTYSRAGDQSIIKDLLTYGAHFSIDSINADHKVVSHTFSTSGLKEIIEHIEASGYSTN